MNYWNLRQVRSIVGGHIVGDGGITPTALSIDTRTIKPGDGFIAIRGQRDGHLFASQAVDRGAAFLLVDNILPFAVPQLVVSDTLLALQCWGQARLNAFRPSRVFGVTGSVGKTSTKELLAAATGAWKTPGNRNNTLGLPEALTMLPSNLSAVVLEMGISTPSEMKRLVEIAPPDYGVITNIGTAHIENFIDGQIGIAVAKGDLVKNLASEKTWVYLQEDSWSRWLASQAWVKRTIAIAVGQDMSFGWENVTSMGIYGEQFMLRFPGGKLPIKLRLRGSHHVRNAALAGTIAIASGINPEEVAYGLGTVEPELGRGRLHPLIGGGWLLDETYNASYDSIIACANSLLELEGGEPVVILGCIRELGSCSERMHKETGESLKAIGIRRVWIYGDYANALAKGFGDGARAFPNYEAMRNDAKGLSDVNPSARILVKGSRFWATERVVDWLLTRFGSIVS
jgi:UDP-N-acetylmuramoyl-tripeptide--D-alanyl-D-alanine ligase